MMKEHATGDAVTLVQQLDDRQEGSQRLVRLARDKEDARRFVTGDHRPDHASPSVACVDACPAWRPPGPGRSDQVNIVRSSPHRLRTAARIGMAARLESGPWDSKDGAACVSARVISGWMARH